MKWIEEGEKYTKYFLNLEKKRAGSNTIKQVRKDNGEIVTDPSNILVEAQKYYENLYKKDKSTNEANIGLNSFLEGITYKKMQDEEKESCEAGITLEEIGEALQQLNNDSAPGSDGITAKFYKTFWLLLKKPLFDCYLESIERGQLSTSQITTIYKGNNTRRDYLNN